ncbi:DUF29 family protein [Aphanothece sacrum]|nr:DUF29 family protein [Aphanothece sacrum]
MMTQVLYDKDYHLWLQETVQFLKEGKLTAFKAKNIV